MMSEQLLNIKNIAVVKLITKLIDTFMFYVLFVTKETELLSFKNFFIWKSANFADSYWFLYNDKTSLHETTTLRS